MLLKPNYFKVKLQLGFVKCQDHDSGSSWVLKTSRFLFLMSMLAKKTRLTKIGPNKISLGMKWNLIQCLKFAAEHKKIIL